MPQLDQNVVLAIQGHAAGAQPDGDDEREAKQYRRLSSREFREILARQRPIAWRARALSSFVQTLSFALAIAYVAMTALMYAMCTNIVTFHESLLIRVDGQVSAALLFSSSLAELAFVFAFWLFVIFLDGWNYNARVPKTGRRGTTREWYDAMQDSLVENEGQLTDGIARALRASLYAKTKSAHVKLWALIILVSSGLSIIVSLVNLAFQEGFPEAANGQVIGFVHALRTGGAFIFGASIPAPAEIPLVVTSGLFLVPATACFYCATLFEQKSFTMNWALLSTPDLLRRYLYYFGHKQNKGVTVYTNQMAEEESLYWLLHEGIEAAPENFFDSDGKLFFFDTSNRDQVYKDFGS